MSYSKNDRLIFNKPQWTPYTCVPGTFDFSVVSCCRSLGQSRYVTVVG